MSLFTVIWSDGAALELAAIWLRAPDRTAVNEAEARINDLLGRDPINNGQHIVEGLYKIEIPPLTAYYSIDPATRAVRISQVVESP